MFQLKYLKGDINKGTKGTNINIQGGKQCGLVYVWQYSMMSSCTVPYTC